MRFRTTHCILAFGLAALTTAAVRAAGPSAATAAQGPTTYSLVRKGATPDAMSAAIYRDGPREAIHLSRSNGWHSEEWFDFAAHKQYAEDSNAPGQCSVITYTSDGPPGLLDPISGGFDMYAQITAQMPANTPSSKEMLGGIETRIVAMSDGSKFWLDDSRHMLLKALVVMQGNPKPQMLFDFTGIRFAKPDQALLMPPAHCTQQKGSSNANGGHAETPIGH